MSDPPDAPQVAPGPVPHIGPRPGSKRTRRLRLVALVVLVVVIAWAHRRYDLLSLISIDQLRAFVGGRPAFGVVVVAGTCAAGVLLHLPAWLMIGSGAAVLGPVSGFVAGWAGGLLGAAVAFQIARQTAQATVQDALLDRFPRLRAFDERLARRGFGTILILRLLLLLSPPLNWAVGLSRVGFRDYLAATAVGILPGVGAICYAADAVARSHSLAVLLEPRILVPLALMMAAMAAGAVWGRRLLGRDGGNPTRDR